MEGNHWGTIYLLYRTGRLPKISGPKRLGHSVPICGVRTPSLRKECGIRGREVSAVI